MHPTTMNASMEKDSHPPWSVFSGFRIEGYPTLYGDNKTPAHVDVLTAGIALAFVLIATSFLLLLPAGRGLVKLNLVFRIGVGLAIGGIIATTNFGQEWEVGVVHTPAPYKPGIAQEIEIKLGVHFGLRCVNVTMVTTKNVINGPLKHEIIDYNEQFTWTWDQGRFGFGPYAGRLQREFREAQRKGLPLPILWVVDYLTLDGEGYRFGRFYRTAGWYTHIVMWASLPSWMLAFFLLHNAVPYGAILTAMTGLLQLLACMLWATIRNQHPLFIPFEGADLTTKFGADFWLTLVNGIVCVVLGIVLYILSLNWPAYMAVFFGIDPLSEFEEVHLTAAEFDNEMQNDRSGATNSMELQQIMRSAGSDQTPGATLVVWKRRTTLKSQRKKPQPATRRLLPLPEADAGDNGTHQFPNDVDDRFREHAAHLA